MKFYCGACTFKQAWDQVTAAFWRRYPNPWSKHVLSEDVVLRKMKDDKLISKRLLTKTSRVPRWGEREFCVFQGCALEYNKSLFDNGIIFVFQIELVGSRVACLVEESVVDPVAKTLTTYTRNITFTRLMVVEEKCVYTVSPNNNEWTSCQKEAWISCDVFGFARAIEKYGIESYKLNAVKAQRGLEYVIEKMYTPDRPQIIPSLPLPQSNMMG